MKVVIQKTRHVAGRPRFFVIEKYLSGDMNSFSMRHLIGNAGITHCGATYANRSPLAEQLSSLIQRQSQEPGVISRLPLARSIVWF